MIYYYYYAYSNNKKRRRRNMKKKTRKKERTKRNERVFVNLMKQIHLEEVCYKILILNLYGRWKVQEVVFFF